MFAKKHNTKVSNTSRKIRLIKHVLVAGEENLKRQMFLKPRSKIKGYI